MNYLKIIFIVFFSLGIYKVHAQETVFVESNQKGRGLLKTRSGECFVITPAHVVEEAVSKIKVIGNKNVLSGGELVQILSGSDLAIVRLIDGGTQNCSFWTVPKNYNDVLNNAFDGYLELRDEFGATSLMKVIIKGKDEEFISIVPDSDKDSFVKGMSGGSLFTKYNGKKVYLGMLQSVDEGVGYVYQTDDMERVLGGFFEENKTTSSQVTQSSINASTSAMSVEEEGYRFDFLDVRKNGSTVICKLKVTSLEKDGELEFHARSGGASKMYDQNGVESTASSVKLGQQSYHLSVGKNYKLIKGVPVPLELTFKEVEDDASGISYLKIQTSSFIVNFRNISFN